MPAALFCSQWATSVPSARRKTDGTSAQLTNQSLPDATVRGADHPDAVRSANFNAAVRPSCSIQLRSMPRSEAASWGSLLFRPAGDSSRSIATDHSAGSVLPHAAAITAASTIRMYTIVLE